MHICIYPYLIVLIQRYNIFEMCVNQVESYTSQLQLVFSRPNHKIENIPQGISFHFNC